MSQLTYLLFVGLLPLQLSGMVIPKESSQFRCRRSSPELDACVTDGLIRVFSKFKDGNLELGLPPLEPLEVPYLSVRQDESNLTLDLTLKNVFISGFTDIQVAKVTANLNDVKKLEVSGKTPSLRISGEYFSEGLIVNFPLHSAGTFSINMTEVTSSWVVYLKEVTRNGVNFLQIDGFNIDMMPVSTSFRPAQQLDGDNRLGEAVNEILNENSSEIYSVMKGKLSEVLSGLLTELANQVLKQVPEDVYLQP